MVFPFLYRLPSVQIYSSIRYSERQPHVVLCGHAGPCALAVVHNR